jgi:arylsulfatase A-like enzyme
MTRSSKCLLSVALALWLANFLFSPPVQAAERPRTNIVFLLADDLCWDGLGCTGNKVIQTPNIDRLARRGVRFRNQFVTTSICCVSRASIFSGQYQRRHRIDDFRKEFSPQAWAKTYPALLRQAGYHTGFIGKFGVGETMPAAAFDFWRGFPGQGAYFQKGGSRHLTGRMGEQALEFLRDVPKGKPFCLSVSFKAPHAQDGAAREFPPDPRDEKLYDGVTIPLPPTASDAFFKRLPEFVRRSEGRKRWQRRFATPELAQRTARDYYRLVTGVDREVGHLVGALRDRNLAGNTLIVFTSDNGFFLGGRGLSDKWFMYEESIRVPLIVFDPQLPRNRQGQQVDALTLNIDLAPTLLDYAGVVAPAVMQGRSLQPLLSGRPVRWRNEFFYEHHFGPRIIPPCEGVRTARWKYIRYLKPNPETEELYDLAADPLERHNLAADPKQAGTLTKLRGRWQALRKELE